MNDAEIRVSDSMESISVEQLIIEGLGYFEISCTPEAVEKLSFYVHELARWNARINLTAKRPVGWMIRELLYDAFFLGSVIRGARSALDMGSGSGILAIPLAILYERVQLFSVDRTLRKIQFQKHVQRELKLGNLSLIHDRIESLEPLNVDALLCKGFGATSLILQNGGKHLNVSGTAYLLKGRTQEADLYPGFVLEDVRRYRLPGNAKEYQIFIYKKLLAGKKTS